MLVCYISFASAEITTPTIYLTALKIKKNYDANSCLLKIKTVNISLNENYFPTKNP